MRREVIVGYNLVSAICLFRGSDAHNSSAQLFHESTQQNYAKHVHKKTFFEYFFTVKVSLVIVKGSIDQGISRTDA